MDTIILYSILYAGVLVFLVACAIRAVGYAKLPLHLRWELYPVPHEEKERAKHGGSYLEVKDYWTKPLDFNMAGELKAMLAEMILLKGLWDFRRKMWFRSYPFHLGLYMVIVATGLLFLSACLSIVAPGLWAGGIATVLHYCYATVGLIGAVLTLVGAAALLIARLTDEDLKPSTTSGDIFNLSFFLVTVGFIAGGYVLRPAGTVGALALARGTLHFDTSLHTPPILAAGLVLGALLMAYIPMTHMSHFIAKYFTYHAVRWDDKPSPLGKKLAEQFAEYLTFRPTWAASHVGADGVKTWAEIATTNPPQPQGVKK